MCYPSDRRITVASLFVETAYGMQNSAADDVPEPRDPSRAKEKPIMDVVETTGFEHHE